MWAARQVALGRGQDRATGWAVVTHTLVTCQLAWPPARRAPAGAGSESLSLHLHSGDLDRLQKAPSELVFPEPAGVFLLVSFWFFVKALMGRGGKAAELWEEVEDENIYLFICRDFRKLDKGRRWCILQVEVTSVS